MPLTDVADCQEVLSRRSEVWSHQSQYCPLQPHAKSNSSLVSILQLLPSHPSRDGLSNLRRLLLSKISLLFSVKMKLKNVLLVMWSETSTNSNEILFLIPPMQANTELILNKFLKVPLPQRSLH